MSAPKIQTVAVLGAGQMGGGIAHVCALAELRVNLCDCDGAACAAGLATVEKNLNRQAKKGVLTADQVAAAQQRISTCETLDDWLGEADIVIEAVSENITLKKRLYERLYPFLTADTIFASNTSSYSITALAQYTPVPSNFIGMHFMNPVPMMPLVEIIVGKKTSAQTLQRTEALAALLGKQTVRANDSPGFITNRILLPMLNEAMLALHEGVGGVRDIDRAMQLGMNHPMGPLALADYIGLDTCLAVMNVLCEGLGEEKFRPCPLLKEMVAAGHLGRKSGVGFYDYRPGHDGVAAQFQTDGYQYSETDD